MPPIVLGLVLGLSETGVSCVTLCDGLLELGQRQTHACRLEVTGRAQAMAHRIFRNHLYAFPKCLNNIARYHDYVRVAMPGTCGI